MSFLARSILAFLLAPAFFGMVLFGLSFVIPPPLEFTRTVLLSIFIGFPLVAIVCVPVFMLLTRQGLTGVATYLVSATLLSALIATLIVIAPVVIEERDIATLITPALLSEIAALVTACFVTTAAVWLVTRPDRHVATS